MACLLLLFCSVGASHSFLSAPQAQSDETQLQRRVRLHVELGAGYYSRAQYDVALEELNEAIRLDTNYAPAHGMLGLVYMQLKEMARAENEFQRAIITAPNSRIYEPEQLKDTPVAVSPFNGSHFTTLKMLEGFVKKEHILVVNAGTCSSRFGDAKAAEDYFLRALKSQPNNISALLGLTDLDYRAGRYEQARNHLRSAMQTPVATPAALLLGVCIERKLGDRQTELSFMQQLYNHYPESTETKRLRSGGCE